MTGPAIQQTLRSICGVLRERHGSVPVRVLLGGDRTPEDLLVDASFDRNGTRSVFESTGLEAGVLDELEVGPVTTVSSSRYVSVELNIDDLDTLLQSVESTRSQVLTLDNPVYPMLMDSTVMVGAQTLWDEGLTGARVKVGVVDTGVDPSTPFLNLSAARSFVSGETEADTHGHGTHVAGIVGATDRSEYRGVAPDSIIVSGKALGMRGGTNSSVAAAIQWCVDNDAKVINLSFGGPYSAHSPKNDAIKAATGLGVVCVAAAGNEGPEWGTVHSPGCLDYVLTVGAVDKAGRITNYSSRGPVFGRSVKPDVVAPGGGSAQAQGPGASRWPGIVSLLSSNASSDPSSRVGAHYVTMIGTSMATPHVAGAAAIILQTIDEESISTNGLQIPQFVKNALMSTAKDLGRDSCEQGAGMIQIPDAVKAVREGRVPSEMTLPSTRAPHDNYECGGGKRLTSGQIRALAVMQKRFLLPVNDMCRALIDVAGRGDKVAVSIVALLVPVSVTDAAVADIRRTLRALPERYVDLDVKTAVSEYVASARARTGESSGRGVEFA
ncbi:MAG: S8 family peptidase [Candidatus Thorarchaeota archaeon]